MGVKAESPPPDLRDEVHKEMLRLMTASAQKLAASCAESCIQQVWTACLACVAAQQVELLPPRNAAMLLPPVRGAELAESAQVNFDRPACPVKGIAYAEHEAAPSIVVASSRVCEPQLLEEPAGTCEQPCVESQQAEDARHICGWGCTPGAVKAPGHPEESLPPCAAGGVIVRAASNGEVDDGIFSELVLPHAVGAPQPLVDDEDKQDAEPELEEELEALQCAVTTLAGQLAVLAAEATAAADSVLAQTSGIDRAVSIATTQAPPPFGATGASLAYLSRRYVSRLSFRAAVNGHGDHCIATCSATQVPGDHTTAEEELAAERHAFEEWLNVAVGAAAVMLDQRDHFRRLAALLPASNTGAADIVFASATGGGVHTAPSESETAVL